MDFIGAKSKKWLTRQVLNNANYRDFFVWKLCCKT